MDEDEVDEWPEAVPARFTPLRFTLAALGFISEVTQAVANLSSTITMMVCQHVSYDAINREFEGIVKNYDNPSSIGPGSPESQD